MQSDSTLLKILDRRAQADPVVSVNADDHARIVQEAELRAQRLEEPAEAEAIRARKSVSELKYRAANLRRSTKRG